MYHVPDIFKAIPGLIAAESNRQGGVSPAPFDSLNLGLSTPDDPQHIAENRKIFFNALGIGMEQVVHSHQIHSDEVLIAGEAGHYSGYDAIIIAKAALFAAVTTADCVPVLICDPVRKVAAAIHAGWPGSRLRLVGKTLRIMQQDFGTRPSDCFVRIGPCIDAGVYEVGDEVARWFDEAHKVFYPEKGKYHLRLKAANVSQLLEFGVPADQISVSPDCTFQRPDMYFSHRRDRGQTGRMLSVIGWRG